MDDIRNYVKDRYAGAIRNSSSCCGSGGCCCGTAGQPDILNMTEHNYAGVDLVNAPEGMAGQSFGCGNPLAGARIRPGETVLDLGCGAGLDLFLASEATGPSGKVIGLDMTDEMLETAAENLKELGNVTLLKGYIETMPLESCSVDVIVSNCVINLSPDKGKVLKEAFRVLRPGGRFCVSDTVFVRKATRRAVKNLAAWSDCIAGALQETEYADLLQEAGFGKVEILRTKVFDMPDTLTASAFPNLNEEERREIGGAFASALILAEKPCPGS